MTWLRSTSNQSYTVEGKVIPSYKDAPLQLDDSLFNKIADKAVIKSLLANGGIVVLDKYEAVLNADDATLKKLQQLTTENAKLADKIRELEGGTGSDELNDLKAEREVHLKEITEWEEKYKALEAEATEAIANLKAQLEAATAKKSSKKSAEKAEE